MSSEPAGGQDPREGQSARTRLMAWLRQRTPAHEYLALSLALLFAHWLVSVVLRALQLGRPSPFGGPFVEKFEAYYFHALSYDMLWSLPLALPAVAFYLVVLPRSEKPSWLYRAPFLLTLLLHIHLLMLVVLDHEAMRFMARHATPSFVDTYGGWDSFWDLGELTSTDQGGAFLPLALLLTTPFALAALTRWLGKRLHERKTRTSRLLILALALPTAGYVFAYHIWTGSFRERKLRPVAGVWWHELGRARPQALDAAEYTAARDTFRALFSAAEPDRWVFPLDDYPFYRLPIEQACADGTLVAPDCALDQDQDGAPRSLDCDDQDPSAHPGAEDVPSNGVDENCDGMDARPYNVVLIILESHRAKSVGHLAPFGATESSSPVLDSLAQRGAFWTRHSVNGLPTIEGFFSIHCSTYSVGRWHIATEYTDRNFDCLPPVLRRHGYTTRFFSASEPDWDNQTIWLHRWYGGYDFDRSRQTDLSLLSHMGQWMIDNLSVDTPFFVAAITKSNHFPFRATPDMTEEERAKTPDHLDTTMRYADRALGELLRKIENAPWFERTVVIVTADHGINVGEHGSWRFGDPMHRPSTWLPLVMVGSHPELADRRGPQQTISSHADLMPTILDLVGIREPTAALGHSLLQPHPPGTAYSYAAHGTDLVFEQGNFRSLLPFPGEQRDDGSQLFDVTLDFHEEDGVPVETIPLRRVFNRHVDVSTRLHQLGVHSLVTDRVFPRQP